MPVFGSFGGISVRAFRPDGIQYSISPSTTSVNEGSSVTFTITTVGFGSGTLYWTLEAVSGTVNNSDFSSPANAVNPGGSVTITNNSGSFSVTLANDATTEGTESFLSRLRTGSTSGTIVATSATVTISDTSVFSFTPFSFTPFSFTPFSFTPFSFTPFSFTPFSFTPFSFTPEPFSFTPFSFTPFSFTPFSFTPFSFTPFSFTPSSYYCPCCCCPGDNWFC